MMNAYNNKNTTLLKKWEKAIPESCESFIFDGIIDPESWAKSEVKILFILKEAHGGGNWDIANQIKKDRGILKVGGTASPVMHNRLAEWAYAIHQGKKSQSLNLEEERKNDYPNARKAMLSSAYMNLKKVGGISQSDDRDLKKSIKDYLPLLEEQLDMIKPNVIVCGGTFHLIENNLLKGAQKIDTIPNAYRIGNTIIFATWHPSYLKAGIVAEELWEKGRGTFLR